MAEQPYIPSIRITIEDSVILLEVNGKRSLYDRRRTGRQSRNRSRVTGEPGFYGSINIEEKEDSIPPVGETVKLGEPNVDL